MNRLWVRLSLMIGGVLFFMFFLQFLSIVAIPDPAPAQDGDAPTADRQMPPEERTEISRRLIDFALFSLLVGTAGGIVISRVVTSPINHLVKAAQRIGAGDLSVRVPARGSQEMVDLAHTFNQMAVELQHAETLRTNLMADVSHELRTPLTVLDGNLRAALDHVYVLDEPGIANLYGQTHHLIRLVNDLRELAQAEACQLPLEKRPTDLNVLVSDVLQALEPLTAEKRLRVVNQTDSLPPANVDALRIRQVLFNLLSNAIRYTPAGGEISVSGTIEAGQVCLAVRDSGEGIETEQLSAVFDRFYRVDPSRSRETGGSGLGLAIAKAIVEAHGGRIEAASDGKGRGSTFSVMLPVG